MRLIDADKLFEFIQKEKAWKQSTIKYPRYEQGKYDAFYEMLEVIKNQPTVAAIPAPVKCGKCALHDHCKTEDIFIFSRLSDDRRFCGVGWRKDGTK